MKELLDLPIDKIGAVLESTAKYLATHPKVTCNPYPDYDSRVMAVLGTLKTDGEYMSHYEAIKNKPIATFTLAEVATFYTFIQRGERFSDGHIASFVENGTLYELVKRQRELLGIAVGDTGFGSGRKGLCRASGGPARGLGKGI